jgi:peroxygenase
VQHGSDSGTYDPEGRFVPQHFEDMFAKYDRDEDGALSLGELFEMMHGQRCAADPFGVCSCFPSLSWFIRLRLTGAVVGCCVL